MFQLYDEEYKNLIFQIGISSWGVTRKLPCTFTGVAMLSGVLRSERAIQVNIPTMRIFTRIKHILNNHSELNLDIEKSIPKNIRHSSHILTQIQHISIKQCVNRFSIPAK